MCQNAFSCLASEANFQTSGELCGLVVGLFDCVGLLEARNLTSVSDNTLGSR